MKQIRLSLNILIAILLSISVYRGLTMEISSKVDSWLMVGFCVLIFLVAALGYVEKRIKRSE